MDIVVAYDIRTDTAAGRRRLRKVSQQCLNYGQRVQYSVFECRVDDVTFARLRAGLEDIVNPREDSLRIYRIDTKVTWTHGIDRYIDFEDPLIY